MMALSGCGGSDGPPPDADPTGYYDVTGTATVDDGMGGTTSITDLQAIVYNSRIMMMSVDNGLLYDGTITSIDQNDFTADVTIYTDGQNPMSATVSGTITQGSSITGTLTGTGAGSGSFSLSYASTNNQVAAQSRVENSTTNATWGAFVGNSTSEYEFKIDPFDPDYFVDDVNGVGGVFDMCQLTDGAQDQGITPIADTNLYNVDVRLYGCATVAVNDDNYTGFATTRSQTQTDDTLVFILIHTDGTYAFYGDFQ
jgi:hypothetical protein